MPKVTRKLGSPVRCKSHPLKAPIAKESTSARNTPTHTFRPKYHAMCAQANPDVVTATPADRPNSPPIISSATATAMMPMVADW